MTSAWIFNFKTDKLNSVGRSENYSSRQIFSTRAMFPSFAKILGEWFFFLILIGSHISMQYFPIDEQCSNVQDITNLAREGFGKPSLILVQANGLKIEDSPVTQCMFCITSVLLIYLFIFIIFWIVIRNVKHWALKIWRKSRLE